MWIANMVLCIGIGFGCFAWALWKTVQAEGNKK